MQTDFLSKSLGDIEIKNVGESSFEAALVGYITNVAYSHV